MKQISAKGRYVKTCIWTDSWILEDLEPLQKLLFLYLLTNQYTNIAGVYELPMSVISFETGIPKEQVKTFLGDFEFAGKVRYFDGWIILRNFTKHQKEWSEDVRKGIQRILDCLPEPVRAAVDTFRSTPEPPPRPPLDPPETPHRRSNSDSDSDSDLAVRDTKKAPPPAPLPPIAPKDYREALKVKLMKAEIARDPAALLMAGMELMQGVPFPNYAKEWTAAKQVIKKIRTVSRGKDEMQSLRSLLAAFQHKRKSSRQEFWRESPLTPSSLNSRFDQLIGFAQKEHENAQLDEISLEAIRGSK